MELSKLESYTRNAKDADVTRYTKDAVEEVSTANIKSRDPAAHDELYTVLQKEKKVRNPEV